MASTQKKRRPKSNWFLACFGISSKTVSEKKSGGRKKSFKLCMPKIRVIIIRRKKVSSDVKIAALKATQNMIMLEATKIQQLKLKHGFITQQPNVQPKERNDHKDLQQSHVKEQLNATSNHKQGQKTRNQKHVLINKVTKDSMFGVSTMLIALMIMSIWGRLCAILCMSAWLYCAPLLSLYKDTRLNHDHDDNNIDDDNNNIVKVDLNNSEFYNKKLVLQGLLQRDHKTGIGISGPDGKL